MHFRLGFTAGVLLALAVAASGAEVRTPALFVCGDSTANSPGDIQGWGTPIAGFFDPAKLTVRNVAHAGTSSRTYYDGDWPKVLPQIQPGDIALIVFGINDGGLRTPGGLGDEVNAQGYHTYGWYLSAMTTEARARGARVYLLTVTARNIWTNPRAKFQDATITSQEAGYDPADDRIERGTGNGVYTQWTKDVGNKLNVPVLDLTNLLADRYERMGREKVMVNFKDHNHTYPAGAAIVAEAIVSGLKAFSGNPFGGFFSAIGLSLPAADAKYVSENAAFAPLKSSDIPTSTQIGTGPIPAGSKAAPPEPADAKLPTLWLIGDSTVRNGSFGDGTNLNQWGWGAPLVAYFNSSRINVVNRAWGGTSSRSFYEGWYWKTMQPLIKKGDFVMLQFGANDSATASLPGTGDETQGNLHTFGWYLKQYVREVRAAGATVIICSLTPRKAWTPDAKFARSNTTHAAWAADVAKETGAPFVDLYELIARRYEKLGPDKVDALYVPSPTEHLHTGWEGAVINSECVIAGLAALKDDPLAAYFSERGKALTLAP